MSARQCKGLIVACAMAAVFLAACSSTTTGSTATSTSNGTANSTANSTASTKAALCTSAANLKKSIQDLKSINIRADGISAVSDQFTKIEQELKTLKADAHGQYSTQINDLSKALSNLGSSLNAAKANLNGGTLSAVASSAGSVVSTGNNLVNAVTSTC